MQLELPKETTKKVDEAAKILGVKKNEVIDRAILIYLDSLQNYLELKKELFAWDKLSDEALFNFEKSL